jgi:phosphate transport system permease protein
MKIRKDIAQRKRTDTVFSLVGLIATLVGIVTLLALMIDLAWDGTPGLIGIFSRRFRPGFRTKRAFCPPGWAPAWLCS